MHKHGNCECGRFPAANVPRPTSVTASGYEVATLARVQLNKRKVRRECSGAAPTGRVLATLVLLPSLIGTPSLCTATLFFLRNSSGSKQHGGSKQHVWLKRLLGLHLCPGHIQLVEASPSDQQQFAGCIVLHATTRVHFLTCVASFGCAVSAAAIFVSSNPKVRSLQSEQQLDLSHEAS